MNKSSGADGIPAKLFQILKDDAVKVLHSICQQIWKLGTLMGLGHLSFSESRLNTWKFLVYILLKPLLENTEHYFAIV